MKKILVLGLCSLVLVGCESTETEDVTTEESTIEQEVRTVKLPTEEIGDGNFYIVNESGSSESGDVVAFYDDDLLNPHLGFEAWEMDGSHKTFIYFDGELVAEKQLSDSQGSFDIPKESYDVGIHTVTAIQYDDDTEDGTPIFVRNVNFEIKE